MQSYFLYFWVIFFSLCLSPKLYSQAINKQSQTKISSSSFKLSPPLKLDSSISEDAGIREIIAPYRIKLRRMVSRQIAQVSRAIELVGLRDSSLGPLLASFLLEEANSFAGKYQYPVVDLAFMGFYGVRKSRLVGGISISDMYELMPFENTLSIVAMLGDKLYELARRFVKDQVLHPLYGMQIWISGNKILKLLIKGRAVERNKTYYVAVPSYWAQGGDGMQFFTQGLALDTRMKIRDLFTKHFALIQNLDNFKLPKLCVRGLK